MRRIYTLLATGFSLLVPGIIHADDAESVRVPLEVSLIQEAAEFEVPYFDAFITAGENKFTFIVPQGLRVKGDPAKGRLTLGNLDGDCSISFSILRSASMEGTQVNVGACRALVLSQHSGGKILKELSANVCGRTGQGFDIEWKPTEDMYQYERIVFIPTKFGMFVFTATSGYNGFPKSQSNLGLVMSTFRASTDGKFKPAQIAPVN